MDTSGPSDDGVAFFATSEQLRIGEISDEELVAQLRLLSQDATVFVLSRVAQVLHFCGELDRVRQLEVADLLFHRRGVRRVKEAFALGARCFITYEGATRLALLAVMYSPRGAREPDGPMATRMGSLIPAIHRRVFTHPVTENPAMIHTEEFRREGRLQLFLAASATAATNPRGDLGVAFNLGALAAERLDADTTSRADQELASTLGVTARELHAVAVHIVSKFTAIPADGEDLPTSYCDAVVLNSQEGYCGLIHRLFTRLSVQRTPEATTALTIIRSPRTGWPLDVAWRPFYVSGDAAVCWDIRTLHQMISWGFPWMVKPFLTTDAFGGLSNAWNSALESVIEEVVSAALPGFSRPKDLPSLPIKGGKKNADWIAMSGTDGLVVEFKNASAPPSTFEDPTPDYFEHWARGLFISPQGLEQVYVTILRMQGAAKRTLAWDVGHAEKIWPIVVSPINVPQSLFFQQFIDGEAAALRTTLPPLPAGTQAPTLMDIEELFAFAALPPGTHGAALAEFHEMAKVEVMWTFDRYLYKRFGQVPHNEKFPELGGLAADREAACLDAVQRRFWAASSGGTPFPEDEPTPP